MPATISSPCPWRPRVLPPSPLLPLSPPLAGNPTVRLFVKRDDRYAFTPGSPLQGNKVRKLMPLLIRPDLPGQCVVSFGGAYSNHVAALSAAGRRFGFRTRFYIRGEAVSNPVLELARANGAELRFVSRSDYRRKHEPETQCRLGIAPDAWVVPEGGSTPGQLAHAGEAYSETVTQLGHAPDYFCLSAGTGGTAAAVLEAAGPYATRVEVFPALRGEWLRQAILDFLPPEARHLGSRLALHERFAGRGYAKFPPEWRLHRPAGAAASRADIGVPGLPPLEPVYTAKLFSGVLDLMRRDYFPVGSTVVVLHTGGIY